MKILVVEDDRAVAQALEILLSSFNYAVDIAADGDAGLQMTDAFDYDLILLDVILPKLDGISLCQHLRAEGFQSPILLLTGQDGGHQKAIALNAGADDYVVKPFDTEELVARVQALLRRGRPTSQPILTWGHLSVDPSSRKVAYGTDLLAVTPKEYAILELFLRNPQNTFSSRVILDRVWTSLEFPSDEAVRVHIKELRKKLTAAGAPKDLIKTKHREGYQLNPLYASSLASQTADQLTLPQIAEIKAVNEKLRTTLEELQVAQEELRQQNEELLLARYTIEQERRHYQDLFEFAPDGYLVTDIQGNIREANRAAIAMIGYQRLIGKPLVVFVAKSERAAFRTQLAALMRVQDWEVTLQPRRGDPFPVLIKLTQIEDAQGEITQLRWALRDIRDRKQIEQQLQAAHDELERRVANRTAQLQILYDQAPCGYHSLDQHGVFVRINDTELKMLGYTQNEIIGKPFSDFLTAESSQIFQDNFPEFKQRGWVKNLEFQMICKDGSLLPVSLSATAIKDEAGNYLMSRSIMVDISERVRLEAERQQAETTLQESEQRYRLMFESNPNPMWFYDPETLAFLEVNQAAIAHYGYSREQFLQRTIADIRPPTDLPALHQVNNRLIPGQPHVGVWRHCKKDGTVIDVEVTAYAFPVAGKQANLVLIKDITFLSRLETERQQAEAAIRESEERFRNMADRAPVMIWLTDPTGYCTYLSQSWYDFSGQTEETGLGFGWLDALHPDDRERAQTTFLTANERHEAFQLEYRFRHHDGEYRWAIDAASPWLGADGQFKGYIGSVLDISDRKRAEAARQQAELALRENEQLLRLALAGAKAGSWDWDVTTGRTTWSPEMYDLHGRDPADEIAHYDNWFSCLHPDNRQRVREYLSQVLEQRLPEIQMEFPIVHPQRGIRWLLSLGRLTVNEQGEPVRLSGINLDISDRKQAEFKLQQQIRQEYLLADIAQDIRHSLNLNDVLSRTVHRVREFLAADRAIVFQFHPDWHGHVIMESVGEGWTPILSTTIYDPCFSDRYIEPYRQGRIATITDIEGENLEPCYVELLKSFQVKANLVVPILQGENLWGLLIAHHCSAPRQWQPAETALLRRLATQVGIAVQQSELYEQTRRELSAREQMQTVLEESEERFRSLSTAAPIGILETNTDGICLYTNARWQEIARLSWEDSLGGGWLQAVHSEDREAFLTAWEAYLQGKGKCLSEFRLLTPQGEIRWVSVDVAAMKSATGEIIGHVSTYEDITERKQAEAALQESEQRLRTILDNSPAAIYLLDPQNHFLFVNRICAEIHSTTSENLVGKSIYEFWSTDIADTFAANNRTLLETGQLLQIEESVSLTDGMHTYITVKFPLCDAMGRPYAICGISTDITAKKQLEAQFYRAQRLESLGNLASGIAHDLNNVLTPILLISQVLRLKQTNVDARSQEMLKVLEESAKRGANTLKQILTFTRGTGGERHPVQITSPLQEAIDLVQQTFPKSISIRQNIPAQSLWLVAADSTYLHQVLMNLCVNARDAMPNGGVLSFCVENCFVDRPLAHTILDAQVGNYVVVTIADTGTGIPPEVRDRIEDPFFTTKEPGQGTGLGLATVLGIVKDYGGFLQVLSEVGQGTQVKVYLPAIEGLTTISGQPEYQLDGNGELVLIVDDEVAVQRSIESLLEGYHYTVLSTNDGMEAIALYAQHQDEIRWVILDMMMPNMSGITLIQKLREMNPLVKIIAISGLPTNREPALAAGANAFLSKPYILESLLEALVTI